MASGRLWVILQIQAYIVYHLCLRLFIFLQSLYRKYVGIDVIPEGKARLCSIVNKQKRDIEEIAREVDFVLVHNQFVDIDFLDSPNWTLYSINKHFAYFVQLPKHVNEYHSQECPFMYVQLFEEAINVAEVTRKEFEKFADKIAERPQPNTILYTNTARCGSTLLAKMLHVDGHSQCYAEPYPLANLSIGLDEGEFTEQDVRNLLPRVITILRAHIPAYKVCILKTDSTGVRLVPYSDDVPQLKHIFSFRKGGLKSVERVIRREDNGDLLTAFYLAAPKLCNYLLGTLTGAEGALTRKLKPDNCKKRAAIVYAASYGVYLKHQECFLMPCLWFKDLINDTENLLRNLFNKIGIPEDLAIEASKWKNIDSQKGTFLSQDSLKHIHLEDLTEQDKKDMVHYAEVMGVPVEILTE